MSAIADLIVNRIVETLTQKMQTEVSPEDPLYADIVKAYRFQDDPTEYNMHVYVTTGESDDPKTLDSRIGYKDVDDLGLKIPSGEVGGGHLWWRNGVAKLGCYFILEAYTQAQAATYAHDFMSKVAYWIERTSVGSLVDSWGERALKVSVVATNFSESGGPDNQYIWRGNVYWKCLTERPM